MDIAPDLLMDLEEGNDNEEEVDEGQEPVDRSDRAEQHEEVMWLRLWHTQLLNYKIFFLLLTRLGLLPPPPPPLLYLSLLLMLLLPAAVVVVVVVVVVVGVGVLVLVLLLLLLALPSLMEPWEK